MYIFRFCFCLLLSCFSGPVFIFFVFIYDGVLSCVLTRLQPRNLCISLLSAEEEINQYKHPFQAFWRSHEVGYEKRFKTSRKQQEQPQQQQQQQPSQRQYHHQQQQQQHRQQQPTSPSSTNAWVVVVVQGQLPGRPRSGPRSCPLSCTLCCLFDRRASTPTPTPPETSPRPSSAPPANATIPGREEGEHGLREAIPSLRTPLPDARRDCWPEPEAPPAPPAPPVPPPPREDRPPSPRAADAALPERAASL